MAHAMRLQHPNDRLCARKVRRLAIGESQCIRGEIVRDHADSIKDQKPGSLIEKRAKAIDGAV
tara:strand:- start:329 stop:517 length:189 start_codon:yes stop_codon:yes gene_type:complete